MSNSFRYTTAIDKIRRMKKRIKVIPGGTSAGKTYAIIPILIDTAIKNPNTSISIVAESMPNLRRGAMRDFLNIMKMTNRYIDSHWNISNSVYTFTNNSYIEFFSADSGDKLRGARRKILFVNECNNIKKDAYLQLAMRTSEDIYLDYNPTHKFWIEDVLKSDEAEKLVLTYKDNEALDDTIIDFLEEKRELAKTSEYWRNWCDVYLDGKQGRLDGVIFNNWDIIDNIPNDARLLGVGLDFGFSNDPAAATAIYKWNSKLILDELFYETGLLNSDISKRFNELIPRQTYIYADSAEPKSIAELQRYGHRVFKAKKGKDSINYGISILQEYDILITNRSNNVKEEFSKYSWKEDRDGEKINVPEDRYNHAIDGIRYFAVSKLDSPILENQPRFKISKY